jgi:predicted nucleotidyltransferase
VLDVLATIPGIRLVMLFGSLAKGSATPDSDLDLAVDLGHRLEPDEKKALIEALALATGRPVDLVDLRTAGEPLLTQILRHGQLLHGSVSDYASLLSRHLIDNADFAPYRNRILSERRRQWIGK